MKNSVFGFKNAAVMLLLFAAVMVLNTYNDDPPPLEPLEAPKGLVAIQEGTTVLLSWKSATDTDSYIVEKSTGSTFSSEGKETESTLYIDTQPVEGTNYYRVTAINETDKREREGATVECIYTTPNPKEPGTENLVVPEGLAAANDDENGYTMLSWSPVTGATEYIVYRSTTENEADRQLTADYMQLTSTSVRIALQEGANYFYVKAKNREGVSDFSAHAYPCYAPKEDPGGGMASGLYMGIISFNEKLNPKQLGLITTMIIATNTKSL